MKYLLSFVVLLVADWVSANGHCPDTVLGGGGVIYDLKKADCEAVLKAHNKYRQMLQDGEVPNQPQAKVMPILQNDEILAEASKVVTNSCEMKHNIINDNRFTVGQNLFIQWFSSKTTDQEWETALESWYSEYMDYTYSNSNDHNSSYYTQLMWANTELVGCSFSAFYDTNPKKTEYPYAKLYACNYGPAGNVDGEYPYEKV